MDYSKAIAVIRAAKGLQQKELAQLLDVTPSYISRIEKGERPMTNNMVDMLIHRLKIPKELFYLLGNDSEKLDQEDSKNLDEMSKQLLLFLLGR